MDNAPASWGEPRGRRPRCTCRISTSTRCRGGNATPECCRKSVRTRFGARLGQSGSRVTPRSNLLVFLLVALLLLVGCGGSEEAETTGDPGEITFELDEVGDAGVAGVRATLTYETPEKTTITVDGLDEGEPAGGGANPVLLRSGTCDEPKDIVFELEKLSGATSETTVELALTALLTVTTTSKSVFPIGQTTSSRAATYHRRLPSHDH